LCPECGREQPANPAAVRYRRHVGKRLLWWVGGLCVSALGYVLFIRFLFSLG
jgi:hypothetical protein